MSPLKRSQVSREEAKKIDSANVNSSYQSGKNEDEVIMSGQDYQVVNVMNQTAFQNSQDSAPLLSQDGEYTGNLTKELEVEQTGLGRGGTNAGSKSLDEEQSGEATFDGGIQEKNILINTSVADDDPNHYRYIEKQHYNRKAKMFGSEQKRQQMKMNTILLQESNQNPPELLGKIQVWQGLPKRTQFMNITTDSQEHETMKHDFLIKDAIQQRQSSSRQDNKQRDTAQTSIGSSKMHEYRQSKALDLHLSKLGDVRSGAQDLKEVTEHADEAKNLVTTVDTALIDKHANPTPKSYQLDDIRHQYNLDMNFQQGSPSKMINVNVDQNEVNEIDQYCDPDTLLQINQMDQEATVKHQEEVNRSQTSQESNILKQLNQFQLLDKNNLGLTSVASSFSKIDSAKEAPRVQMQSRLSKQPNTPKSIQAVMKIVKSPLNENNQKRMFHQDDVEKTPVILRNDTMNHNKQFQNRFRQRFKVQCAKNKTMTPQRPQLHYAKNYRSHEKSAQEAASKNGEQMRIKNQNGGKRPYHKLLQSNQRNIHEIVIEETILSSNQYTIQKQQASLDSQEPKTSTRRDPSKRITQNRHPDLAAQMSMEKHPELFATGGTQYLQGKSRASMAGATGENEPKSILSGELHVESLFGEGGHRHRRQPSRTQVSMNSFKDHDPLQPQQFLVKGRGKQQLNKEQKDKILNREVPWLIDDMISQDPDGKRANNSRQQQLQNLYNSGVVNMQLLLFDRARQQQTQAKDIQVSLNENLQTDGNQSRPLSHETEKRTLSQGSHQRKQLLVTHKQHTGNTAYLRTDNTNQKDLAKVSPDHSHEQSEELSMDKITALRTLSNRPKTTEPPKITFEPKKQVENEADTPKDKGFLFDYKDLLNFHERIQLIRKQYKKQSMIKEMLGIYKSKQDQNKKDEDLEFIHSKNQRAMKQGNEHSNELESLRNSKILLSLNDYFNFKQLNHTAQQLLKDALIKNAFTHGISVGQLKIIMDQFDQSVDATTTNNNMQPDFQKDIKKVWISQRYAALSMQQALELERQNVNLLNQEMIKHTGKNNAFNRHKLAPMGKNSVKSSNNQNLLNMQLNENYSKYVGQTRVSRSNHNSRLSQQKMGVHSSQDSMQNLLMKRKSPQTRSKYAHLSQFIRDSSLNLDKSKQHDPKQQATDKSLDSQDVPRHRIEIRQLQQPRNKASAFNMFWGEGQSNPTISKLINKQTSLSIECLEEDDKSKSARKLSTKLEKSSHFNKKSQDMSSKAMSPTTVLKVDICQQTPCN